MSLTTARLAAALDTGLTSVNQVAWSENGTSESSNLAATTVTLKSATVANPSVKSNNGALESAAASADCTITHFAFKNSSTGLQTTWNQLSQAAVLLAGGKITAADGSLSENLHQTTAPPA